MSNDLFNAEKRWRRRSLFGERRRRRVWPWLLLLIVLACVLLIYPESLPSLNLALL